MNLFLVRHSTDTLVMGVSVNPRMKSLLSLAMKAGMVKAGEQACEIALADGTARLVIVSEDASDNTKKRFINKSLYYKKPCYLYGTKEELSRTIGKLNRSVIVITDQGFGESMLNILTAIKQHPEIRRWIDAKTTNT